MRNIENFSKCRVRTARAYSSTNDKSARWPKYNFTDVVSYALANPGRDDFDVVVMSAPTMDITNMDTARQTPADSKEVFEQKAIASSQNMFNIAVNSLKKYPSLKKVVLMEHLPRFDTPRVDPTSLKSTLARLANTTLGELWLKSPLKNRIFIGQHSLESSGAGEAHFARYENCNTGRYDGVHLYGQSGVRDYTNSVKSILMMALPEYNSKSTSTKCGTAQPNEHQYCPQTEFQNKPAYHPSVQPMNRFSVFNSHLGN